MVLDDYDWRPIAFEGTVLPPSFMAISILEPVLKVDDDLGKWLWRFPICCGRVQEAAANDCERFAGRAIDLMLKHRVKVLDGILDRLGQFGFDPETTYRDWMIGLQQIQSLSKIARSVCIWSAPSHPQDKTPEDFERFFAAAKRRKPI